MKSTDLSAGALTVGTAAACMHYRFCHHSVGVEITCHLGWAWPASRFSLPSVHLSKSRWEEKQEEGQRKSSGQMTIDSDASNCREPTLGLLQSFTGCATLHLHLENMGKKEKKRKRLG